MLRARRGAGVGPEHLGDALAKMNLRSVPAQADAVKGSAQATGAALATLGKTFMAFAGNFQASEDRKTAGALLGEATAAASAATSTLADAPPEPSQDDAAALARETASTTGDAAKKAAKAASKTASALSQAAEQSELGASARDAAVALGNTVASAGLFGFRAAQGALGKAQGAAADAAAKKAPTEFED
mmetsp:Transcript_29252/g.90435  ORF Transcript_29252/g.90435 Transcript_29252/m.90435 type:complete len:188 (-) Transcript_29252:50-613(-)